MSLYVKELAGTLGRVQIAMQPDIAGPSSALTLSGTPAYTIQGAGGGQTANPRADNGDSHPVVLPFMGVTGPETARRRRG